MTAIYILYIYIYLSCRVRFKEVSFAYEVLSDTERRAQYDEEGRSTPCG